MEQFKMNYLSNKKFYSQLIIFSFLMVNVVFTYGQALGNSPCSLGTDDAPTVGSVACLMGRVITILMYLAGAVFIGMIAYGAIKLAMANGDPKGYEGAKNTWTYAIIGVGVITGVFGIFSIVGKLFGINFLDPNSMVTALEASINELFELATVGN